MDQKRRKEEEKRTLIDPLDSKHLSETRFVSLATT